MRTLRLLLTSCLLLAGWLAVPQICGAQTAAPVTVAVQSRPPFTPQLSDWTDPVNNRMNVTVLLNDRTKNGYQGRLRVTVKGQGITLVTRPEFQPPPLTLTYGIPVQLTAVDLQPYLDLNNLAFQGNYSRESYLSNGGLPHGSYSVCVEVFDYLRNEEGAASLPGCTFVRAQLLDPPVVTTPEPQVPYAPVQNILVNWQARHVASFSTNYLMELYEVPVGNTLSAEMIYALNQPFVTKRTVGVTSAPITAADPPMPPGRYLVRVRASDMMGSDVFKNGGYSAPYFFDYGDAGACPPPSGVVVDAAYTDRAKLAWGNVDNAFYKLEFREKAAGKNWYTKTADFNDFELEQLNSGVTYEARIRSVCYVGGQDVAGGWGPLYEFSTEEITGEELNSDCTVAVSALSRPDNKDNIAQLTELEEITVGGFKMKIKRIERAAGGGWTGLGQIKVVWLHSTVNVRFVNLFVNTDREVYDGNVVALDKGLSSLKNFRTPNQILADRTEGTDFCGNLAVPPSDPSAKPYKQSTFYANPNTSSADYIVPFDPNNPTATTVDESRFVDKWNPNNTEQPYVASDYSNPNNPYTKEEPFDGTNIYNPYNYFNPYDKLNYDDPANPWTPEVPWTPQRMFAKQKIASGLDLALDLAGGITLPKKIGGPPNMIAVYGMKFTPTGATFSAYFEGDIPKAGKHVAFQATGVGFNPNGLQGEVKLKLISDVSFNWSDKMRLTIQGGSSTYVTFDCGGLNRVSIGMAVEVCRDILVPLKPNTWVRDEDNYVKGTFVGSSSGWGDFAGQISITPFELTKLPGWGFTVQNAVFDFSDETTPLAVKFPLNYTHPDADPTYRDGKHSPKWTGFYMEAMRVRIPDQFAGKAQGENLTFGVESVIIDQTGVTGSLYAANVLSIEQGRADSWPIGIDSVAVGIQSNQFSRVSIAGLVKVPAIDQPLAYDIFVKKDGNYHFSVGLTETVSMNAMIAQLDLHGNSKLGFQYREVDDNYSFFAELNGEVTFGKTGEGASDGAAKAAKELKIPSIQFADFKLTSREPYVENIGSWALAAPEGEQPGLKGFPLTINQVGMFQNIAQTQVAFGIDLSLNLMQSSDQGFAAAGKAFIICDVAMNPEEQRQEWTFNRVRVDQLEINYQGAGFAFQGYLKAFEENRTYGNGFQAGVRAEFEPGFEVSAMGMFGRKDDFRYWMVDASVAFNPGVVLGATGLAIYGFGGGISYHMKRVSSQGFKVPDTKEAAEAKPQPKTRERSTADASAPPPVVTGRSRSGATASATEDARQAALASQLENGDPLDAVKPLVTMPSRLGESLSETIYSPDANTGLGLKATVAFGAVSRNTFNGDITLEMQFTTKSALQRIGLVGNLNVMTPPGSELPPAASFYMDMGYDFPNKTFDATLKAKIWVAGGLIRGAYPGGVAGVGKIHASPQDWFVYIGTPTERIKLGYDLSALGNMKKSSPQREVMSSGAAVHSTELGPVETNNIGLMVNGYLDMGSKIPPFPGLPPIMKDILGGDYSMNRTDANLASAKGILFGAGLDYSVPSLKFLIFYASFYAGAGFDAMLADYGSKARCLNDLNNPNPIGFNGWYATGQFYAYVQGSIGIDIKLGFLAVKAPILKVAVAALLQAKMPNPIWARGVVGGRFSIMGGLVKGKCKFEFEMGKECIVVPGGTEELEIIQSVTPTEGEEDISVFVNPQATFNFPIGRQIALRDQDSNFVELRAEMVDFQVRTAAGATVAGEYELRPDGLSAIFTPDDVLPGKTRIEAQVSVELWQRRLGISDWELANKLGNAEPFQRKQTTFTTGEAPDHIDPNNVRYTYPINRQLNYHRDVTDQAYIRLAKGQDYLFVGEGRPDPSKWEQKIRIFQENKPLDPIDFTYDPDSNQLNFLMPRGLADGKISYLQVANLPRFRREGITNVATAEFDSENLGTYGEREDLEVKLRKTIAEGNLETLGEKQLYRLDFRTSNYPTFTAKVGALSKLNDYIDIVDIIPARDTVYYPDGTYFIEGRTTIDDFGARLQPPEAFDLYDLKGETEGNWEVARLIQPEADLSVTPFDYYATRPGRRIYSQFPRTSPDVEVDWRDTSKLGYPPVRAVALETLSDTYEPARLEDGAIATLRYYLRTDNVRLNSHLGYIFYRDDADIWNQVGNLAGSNTGPGIPDDLRYILEEKFVYPKVGTYQVRLHYVLPGQTVPIVSVPYQITYPEAQPADQNRKRKK